MILRAVFLAASVAAFAPSVAHADCVTTCGDVCYTPAGTGYYRAEVTAVDGGSVRGARIAEHLAGPDLAAIGDDLTDVYAEGQVALGASLFVEIAPYTDGNSGTYVYNIARPIEGGEVVCPFDDRNVPVDQFAAMAASPDCVAISQQLQIAPPPCNDVVSEGSCSAGSGGLGFGAAGALALVLRRRRRA